MHISQGRLNFLESFEQSERCLIAPTTEGVYILGDAYQTPVYVGRSDNLYERLSEHPDPNNYCLQRKGIKYFAFEETYNSEQRE